VKQIPPRELMRITVLLSLHLGVLLISGVALWLLVMPLDPMRAALTCIGAGGWATALMIPVWVRA